MLSRDYRDIVAGALLLAAGIAFSWHAAENYNLGSLRRMGPGMFPFGLGLVLSLLGLIVAAQALARPGVMPQVRIWSPFFVLLGVASFATAIGPLGLLPAIWSLVVLSSLAELRLRPVRILLLAAGLSVLAWLIFDVGLGLPTPMLRWSF
jgi:hypothetical protein